MGPACENFGGDGVLALDPVVEQRQEQVVLALVIGVDGTFGEPGERRDLAEGRAVKAVAGEH
jgi:hypothetical protein